MRRTILLLTILLLALPPMALANTDTLIKGVTDFLVERAKENHFYIFENTLKKNTEFQTYFPTTYSYIADGDLKVLLTSKDIWDKAVADDLDTLVTRTFAQSIVGSIDLNQAALAGMDRYLNLMQYLAIEKDGTLLPLNSMPLDADPATRDLINGFWTEPVAVQAALRSLGGLLQAYADVSSVTKASSSELLTKTSEMITAFQQLDNLLHYFAAHQKELRLNTEALQAACTNVPAPFFCRNPTAPVVEQLQATLGEIKLPLQGVLNHSFKLVAYLQSLPQIETKTEQVIVSMRLLRSIGLGDRLDLDKLKRHILFFARLSEIRTPDEVKVILSEYTLPAVSFFVKREKNSNHILLSAFLGYAYGKTFATKDSGNDNDHGIITPIGLEFSHGLSSGHSLSLLLAPVDFGYPVTLKLNGVEDKLAFSDIFSPAAYLAWGLRELPVNLGLAYQRGRTIPTSGDVENRVLFFIAYDMPLSTLY